MPDWFHRNLARPPLFRLPTERARSLAIGIHFRIGYVSAAHLFPAFAGLGLLLVGLGLCRPWLAARRLSANPVR